MTEKKSGQVDLLHGPILKSLIIFMAPIVVSYAFQQLYNAVDTAIVGNILGENSLAAMGSCSSVFDLFVGFANSLGAGFALVSARAYGSGDETRIRRAVAGSIVIGAVTMIVMTILAAVGLRPLLKLIQTPESIFEEAYDYISVIGLWISVMFAYNLFASLLRSIGNSVMPLVFLVISSLLNIFLDYHFIATFHMGVAGAAIATVVSQGVSVVLCIIYILAKTKMLVPKMEDFKNLDGELMKDLAGQGYAMALMGSIVSVGSIILQSGINSLGGTDTNIIAGHTAARKVYMICNLPFIAMGQAMSTFISQNRGADQGERILKGMKLAYVYDFVMAAVVTVILLLTGRTLVHLISGSTNEVILHNGSLYLYVVGPFYAVLGVLIQTRFALQGMGSKWIPMISSVIEFVGKVIFVIAFIPKYGYMAVIFCEPIIWCFMTAQLLYSYHNNSYVKETKKKMKASA